MKIYTVEWVAKIWGKEEVVAENEKDVTEIITEKVKNMRIYESEKGCIYVNKIKKEKNKIEIVKTP